VSLTSYHTADQTDGWRGAPTIKPPLSTRFTVHILPTVRSKSSR